MNYDLLKPVIGGLVTGGAFSLVLGVYNKRTATDVTHNLFGISSTALLQYIVILIMTFSVIVASAFSILIRDLAYPVANPIRFTVETFLMALLPSTLIFILPLMRQKAVTELTWIEYGAMAVKFGLVHILFQFSGIYTSMGF